MPDDPRDEELARLREENARLRQDNERTRINLNGPILICWALAVTIIVGVFWVMGRQRWGDAWGSPFTDIVFGAIWLFGLWIPYSFWKDIKSDRERKRLRQSHESRQG